MLFLSIEIMFLTVVREFVVLGSGVLSLVVKQKTDLNGSVSLLLAGDYTPTRVCDQNSSPGLSIPK